MNTVQTVAACEMSPDLCARIFELLELIWPSSEPVDSAARLEFWRTNSTVHCFIDDEDSSQILAHALIFPREIFTRSGPIRIGALGNVCVDPTHRGRGWGADVARSALNNLPRMNAEVSLFQTPVPEFYEKLGCREIDNPIFDGTRADEVKVNPFADKWQMIYPASFDWPKGEIDLNGPEY